MKREEISQFLEQNGAGNISAISSGTAANGGLGIKSNNTTALQLSNLNKTSEMFNRTDMRIYQELFPGREIKAQKFFDLNTTTPMMRSPSYTVKGARGRDSDVSILSNNGGKQPRRSSVIGSN